MKKSKSSSKAGKSSKQAKQGKQGKTATKRSPFAERDETIMKLQQANYEGMRENVKLHQSINVFKNAINEMLIGIGIMALQAFGPDDLFEGQSDTPQSSNANGNGNGNGNGLWMHVGDSDEHDA